MREILIHVGLLSVGLIVGFLFSAMLASTKIARLKSSYARAMHEIRRKTQKLLAVPARDVAAQEVGAEAQDLGPAGALAKEEELFQELKERCR
jgi:hypothetical protein